MSNRDRPRHEQFEIMEKAEQKRRRRAKLRNFAPPYERQVVKVERINGIGHKLPVTFNARWAWETKQAIAAGEEAPGINALVRTRAAFGYWPCPI